ncbi:MAG: TIGR02117 family protein [Crocinitomicaceae bacterium]
MKTIKIIGLVLFQTFTGIVSLLVIYVMIVLVGALIPHQGDGQFGKLTRIYVQSNGVHTDIWMPIATQLVDWETLFKTKEQPGSEQKYISFGWGDRAFYIETPRWSDLTLPIAFEAAFLRTPCAMHIDYSRAAPEENEQCAGVYLSEESYESLAAYIRESFKTKAGEAILIPGASYYGHDRFYEAKGSYHLFNSCNNWINEGLKVAGLRTAVFAVSPKTVLAYLKKK